MENDKGLDFEAPEEAEEGEGELDNAPRARNRTVMLTPEITGQVRARLQREVGADPGAAAESPSDASRSGGFMSMPGRKPEPAFDARPRSGTVVPPTAPPQARRSGGLPESTAGPVNRPSAPVEVRQQPVVEGDVIEWRKVTPIVAFFVSFDRDANGEVYPLRSGRLIVTSEIPSGGNFLFLQDESVSSMHAIVRVSEQGEVQVLDQLSEHGTLIRRRTGKEVKLSGEKGELNHGDEIHFGDRKFRVCVMAAPEEA